MEQLKNYPTIGVCGLDCGLCPRYYVSGKSRCPGCSGPGFSAKHPSCSFITCCVKKRGLEVCGQCPEFPCSKFKTQKEYLELESSSYPPSRKMLLNLRFIKENGISEFVRRQKKQIAQLEIMLERYDDGRSKSCFCRAAALLDATALRWSIRRVKRVRAAEIRDKAKALKAILKEAALCDGIELKENK